MKKLLSSLIFALCIFTSGCSSRYSPSQAVKIRVVNEITIRVESGTEQSLWRYTNPSKMTKALNCLRLLDPWDRPEANPESASGTRYHIVLTFSDGSSKSYEQIGYSYLREAGGPWRVISSQHALRLPLLLAAVPSDTI